MSSSHASEVAPSVSAATGARTTGGWILGDAINGIQAEYVRIPHADSSLYAVPHGIDEAALGMLSDTFPTAVECGVLNSKVPPSSTFAIVGLGPIGLDALLSRRRCTLLRCCLC